MKPEIIPSVSKFTIELLDQRYGKIIHKFVSQSDFEGKDIEKSRALFDFEREKIIPRRFEVWTCLVGLPMPDDLTIRFHQIVRNVRRIIPANTPFFAVQQQNYHWEVFIIKRPAEQVSAEDIRNTPQILHEVFSEQAPFPVVYRGFAITNEGVVMAKGYGQFDDLREKLTRRIPFASSYQSNLGHVSLGRILRPVGRDKFAQLKKAVADSTNDYYGELSVQNIKFVHESQWYMEDQEVISDVQLDVGVFTGT